MKPNKYLDYLPEKYNVDKLLEIYKLFKKESDQICITSPDGNTYIEESGHTWTKEKMLSYDKMNSWFTGTYVEEVYNELNEKYDVCRARFMKLTKHNRAYSYHQDWTPRIHIPLETNRTCLFLVEDKVIKMHEHGRAYKLDTRYMHTALNLGNADRIHMVLCLTK